MDEFGKGEKYFYTSDDSPYQIEVESPVTVPLSDGGTSTSISAKLYDKGETPYDGIGVFGDMTPSGFDGRVFIPGSTEGGITKNLDIIYDNNCPVEGEEWIINIKATEAADRLSSRPLTSDEIAEAVTIYENTAATLAATPEVQEIAERFDSFLKDNGVDPNESAFTFASGRKTIQCLGS